MSYLVKCPELYQDQYKPKYKQFKFELDHFQKYACEGIDNNENVFVAVATGSGKTVPAEYAIAKAFSENKKAVYISPIKALSNQKYHDFSQEFDNIGIMTGDNKVNPNADLVIMTAEIFRNSLYRQDKQENIEGFLFDPMKVKYVILDEIHYINDKDRGKVWEEIIMLLPKDTQLTMLSATVDQPEILSSWIGNYQQKTTKLITQYKRPVPLKFYLQDYKKKRLIFDKKWHDLDHVKIPRYHHIYWINHSLQMLKEEDKLPSIYFVLSKKNINEYVKKIEGDFLTFDEKKQVEKIWNSYLIRFRKDYETSEQYNELYQLVLKGIGYHHSGIIPLLKEIVEILYSKKLIKVLLATETFAVGVNMPTKTVVFTGLKKFNNGLRLLRTDEFLQMAGRAGRRGIDTFGEVIILPNHLPSELELKKIILGESLKLSSKLQLDYYWVLKNIYYLDQNHIDNLIELVKNSFLERNEIKQLNNLNKNLKRVEIEYKKLQLLVPDENVKQYLELINKMNQKLSNKKRKEYRYKIISLKDNNLENLLEIKNDMDKLNLEIINHKTKLRNHFEELIKFMNQENLLKNYLLTDYGYLVKEINELNGLIFGRLAKENYFDNITFSELLAFLSIFFDNEKNNVSLTTLDQENIINEKEYELLNYTNELSNEYLDKELELFKKLSYPQIHDYHLTLDNYQVVKMWGEGKSWLEIKNIYDDFEGNFCKLILRIHNSLKEVKMVFKILNKNNLVKLIEDNENSIIREIVQTESLYLF